MPCVSGVHAVVAALLLLLLLLLCALPVHADAAGTPAICRRGADADALRGAMAQGRFIAYQPTALKMFDGRAMYANEASIADDLTVLRSRFDSLITYGSLHGAERIPDQAARLGFKAVILGVWDPSNDQEIDNAVAAWRRHPQLVVGLSLGNEVVLGQRGDFVSLGRTIDVVRQKAPALPLTTTEPFHLLSGSAAAGMLSKTDFLLVNVHPVFQPWFVGAPIENAAQFVVNVVNQLADRYCGPILVKETGVPTAPSDRGFSQARQAAFYQHLHETFARSPARAFAYFVAFDAPWRVHDGHPVPGDHPEEAHWGLFDEERRPKPVVATIPKLVSSD